MANKHGGSGVHLFFVLEKSLDGFGPHFFPLVQSSVNRSCQFQFSLNRYEIEGVFNWDYKRKARTIFRNQIYRKKLRIIHLTRWFPAASRTLVPAAAKLTRFDLREEIARDWEIGKWRGWGQNVGPPFVYHKLKEHLSTRTLTIKKTTARKSQI